MRDLNERMRELTVRICFTEHSLGSQKLEGSGRFVFSRSPNGSIIFLASWHYSNMRLAAQLLGRHQDEVGKIHWDINIEGKLRRKRWHRVYYRGRGGREKFSQHEAFFPGQEIAVNCIVPERINDDDLRRLMSKAGQYRGLSPYKPGEYGFFDVVSIYPRALMVDDEDSEEDKVKEADTKTA